MNRYDVSKVGNHHFTENTFKDAEKLLKRCQVFAQKGNNIPSDDANMKHFNWSKDHLDRCYQLLKTVNVVDYSRNNRRHTLKFIGDYEYLNKFLVINKKR